MPRESARQKADRLLIEGRIIVTSCSPKHVSASVRGEGHLWTAGYVHGLWRCDCPVRTDQCSHLHALRRITAPDLPGATPAEVDRLGARRPPQSPENSPARRGAA